MLSSEGPGERVVQIAKRAYIRSQILAIYMSSIAQCTHRAILVTPRVVLLHSNEVDQNRGERLDCIRPSAESHVGTSHMIEGGDVTGSNAGQVVEFDIGHSLQGD